MADKTEKKAATADDEVEILDDEDEGVVEADADAPASADQAEDKSEDQSEDEEGEDGDEEDPRTKAERKRKVKAQKRARAAEREARELRERLEALERDVSSVRQSEATRREETLTQRLTAAEQAFEAAQESGDARQIRTAYEALDEARAEARELKRTRREPDRTERQASAQPPTENPLVDDFLERHDWFDPESDDDDAQVVRTLSAKIAQEGIAPSSKRHFDELESRMKRYLPHRMKAPAGEKKPPRQTSAASTPGNGSTPPGASGKISIPRATLRGFKDVHGLDWDDPDPETRKAARAKIMGRVVESRRNRGEMA